MLYLLYDEYKKRRVDSNARESQERESMSLGGAETGGKGLDVDPTDFEEFRTYFGTSCDMNSSLDKYLEEDLIHNSKEIDLFQFWKDKESSFGPELTRMACDVLSIPITTVTSESVGAYVLNKYRNRLLPQKV